MSKTIHVSVAWPYANGDLHVGHLAGAYLPADIFARYHRLKGNHVLMVSGSDATARRSRSRRTSAASRRAASSSTTTTRFLRNAAADRHQLRSVHAHRHREPSPRRAGHFPRLLERGYLYTRDAAPALQRDAKTASCRIATSRATCPICGYPDARGDQCDNCGNLLDATRADQPAQQERWQHARHPRDGALLPRSGALHRAPARATSTSRQSSTGAPNVLQRLSRNNVERPARAARSPATSTGASRSRWKAGRTSGCTSGSRR